MPGATSVAVSECRESFRRWLEAKRAGRPLPLDALFANEEQQDVR